MWTGGAADGGKRMKITMEAMKRRGVSESDVVALMLNQDLSCLIGQTVARLMLLFVRRVDGV